MSFQSPGSGPIPGVPSQQPTNLFRFGEITLYSTQAYPATTAMASVSSRIFSTPLGSQGQGFTGALTKTETNLKEAGRIPSGQAYDVYGVATQFLGASNVQTALDEPFNDATATVGTLQNLVNNGVLSWDFTQTVVDICPVMLAGAGGGVYGAISQNAAGANTGAMNNGNGGIWMYRKHPVALPGNTTFAILLQFGSRTAAIPAGFGVAVRVVLLGYYKSVIEIG
jgi:hypothetical protein